MCGGVEEGVCVDRVLVVVGACGGRGDTSVVYGVSTETVTGRTSGH